MSPPSTSVPRLRGSTSRSIRSFRSSPPSPLSMAPCIAAPTATLSSGLTPALGSFSKKSDISCLTRGIRVDPPTSITWCTSSMSSMASSSTRLTGTSVRRNKSSVSSSNLARVSVAVKSYPGTRSSTSSLADNCPESARLIRSHSRLSFWSARRSEEMSLPSFLRIISMKCDITMWSTSEPPRWVSPLVAKTSNMPPSMVSSVTSKVPPPRSNTSTFSSSSSSSRGFPSCPIP
mmetsp:Transcript_26485/g.59357  ORF Transcript_26485/g.59357 Transcript_26485/m.59357 type:complete len:233 (-) Transcript_26485:224-922(-)